ncbi:hypothetical protein RRG08_013014 [Elysia crispata]|uniref:Protein kinase domain-containing protein n=1 Tax=Elysia crispata TaxID=231223 RepID=A0AAE1A0L4_9GAST|nr:hypothetical protein RRG08_013014 [Elysia crispata]
MSNQIRDTILLMKKQIAAHRKAEAKQNTLTKRERQEMILSEANPLNTTFPWLTASFVNKLVGGEFDTVLPQGVLYVIHLYKIMEQLSMGQGFRTFLGVMRRNDLWCTIRMYALGEEARVLAITSGNKFFENLITCFKTLNGFFIITRHVKSTPFHNFIKRLERFNDEELRFYAEELVCALEFLHSKGIIHRKFAAANIKLTAEGHIKVCNLEQAYIAIDENGKRQEMPEAEGPIGLDAYMPPEMIDLQVYGYTVDWWNLGVIMYFMMTGKMPFTGGNKRELHKAILFKEPRFESGLHKRQTHNLIKCLLQKDPKKRLGFHGAEEVKKHKYFSTSNWEKVLNGQIDPPFLPATSAVTSLPSALCRSLEHLSGSEPVQKNFSRRELERQQDINLAPGQYVDFELEHDWSVYLLPDVSLESAMHYMHGQLLPPKQADDLLSLEECITKVPELSVEEKNIFRKYASGGCSNPEPLEIRENEDGTFRMLSRVEAEIYDREPDSYNMDFFITSDQPSPVKGSPSDRASIPNPSEKHQEFSFRSKWLSN